MAPPVLIVNDDDYSADPTFDINGKTGGNSLNWPQSVLWNDTVDGTSLFFVPDAATKYTLTPGTRPHPNIRMGAVGDIYVDPNTPAGIYLYPYTVCEILNPSNCDNAIATIRVVAAEIDAVDDDFTATPINGKTGGTTITVLDNDLLNSLGVAPADIKLIPGTPSHPGLMMNADGTITVKPGTPANPVGTPYTYTYTICEILNPTNCDSAEARISVVAATIVANPDGTYTVNGATGNPSVGNVLTNDLLDGALATLDKVRITTPVSVAVPLDPANATAVRPVLNPTTGTISVPAGTPANTYTIPYEICEILNPTNCANTTIEVVVTAAPIVANDNTYGPVKGHIGTLNLGNVLGNDTFNGNVAVLGGGIGQVSLSVVALAAPIGDPGNPVPSIDLLTGNVLVPEGTPDGVYTIGYEICDNINLTTTNCDQATVSITVGSATIDALDDYYAGPINGMVGGTTSPLSVFRNDFLNGTLLNPADVTLVFGTPVTGGTWTPADASVHFTLDEVNGFITVLPETPAGDYVIPYTICENINPATNCDNAIVIIRVGAAVIDAVNDTFGPVNGHTGGTAGNVVTNNDTLNGAPAVVGTPNRQVTVHLGHGATPLRPGANLPLLDTDNGVITVPARTPEGEYQITYRICEVLNPTNCDDAIVTVVVHEAPIVANDDEYDALPNGKSGAVLSMTLQQFFNHILSNDQLNGSNLGYTQLANGTITLTPSASKYCDGSVIRYRYRGGIAKYPCGQVCISVYDLRDSESSEL